MHYNNTRKNTIVSTGSQMHTRTHTQHTPILPYSHDVHPTYTRTYTCVSGSSVSSSFRRFAYTPCRWRQSIQLRSGSTSFDIPLSHDSDGDATESESEMFLFDPYQKYIQSNNETILDQGTPIKTSLVANIRAAYYIINNYFFISHAKNT